MYTVDDVGMTAWDGSFRSETMARHEKVSLLKKNVTTLSAALKHSLFDLFASTIPVNRHHPNKTLHGTFSTLSDSRRPFSNTATIEVL
jgi:hypothetical protein